jgi:tetratricopeptide (TPR) repeat protein
MREAALDALRRRQAALASRIAGPLAAADRAVLRLEILAMFEELEAAGAGVAELKDEVNRLAEAWKELPATAPNAAPSGLGGGSGTHTDRLNASTFVEKGWSLIAAGDHAGAETALLHALELAPDDPRTEALIGWAQMHQEKLDDALASFQRVLLRDAKNAMARVNIGYICLRRRIFGEAIEHLSRALYSDDRKAVLYAHFYLGLVYLEREMYADAETFLEKAIGLGPNLIEAYYHLGHAHWLHGEPDRALETWRRGAGANRFNQWAKRCADMVGSVERGEAISRSA